MFKVFWKGSNFLKIIYLFICRQGERKGERQGKKHQCVVAFCAPPNGDLACNPDMYPDWRLNWRPFGSQAGAQSTEPCQPGVKDLILNLREKNIAILVSSFSKSS